MYFILWTSYNNLRAESYYYHYFIVKKIEAQRGTNMVKVKQGIPTQASVSKALAFNHCIIVAWSHERAQSETINKGNIILPDVHQHRNRLPAARCQEAKLEVIIDVTEAQV